VSDQPFYVEQINPLNEPLLRRFWEVEQAAQRADRAYPVLRDWAALQVVAREPSPRTRHTFVVAWVDGHPVATMDLLVFTQENPHLLELDINVLPEFRRRGIGRALHEEALRLADGRTTFLGEANEPIDGEAAARPFAEALGYSSVHVEHQLILDLPAAPPPPPAADADDGWVMRTWVDTCPVELRAGFVRLRNQMEQDVPRGEIDAAPEVYTAERLAAEEVRMTKAFTTVTAVAEKDGELGGYSKVVLPHGGDFAWQDDTLVMPDHRGHRLGLRLKTATLALIAAEHPERTVIHTWTDPDNTAMYRTNERFGFRPVEKLLEMQRKL
jgi:GNAT superfamily N-acetyltransferase